ncbi:ABC transporter permease [Actinospongicola halichondriae]|uniref:ABC transporter permease n=1 Tax=Actinospongicola halichondriae TaxID=3236844 RepID=UPI003D46A1FA
MRRVTLRSIWEHKRRLVSTVLAIVLGVAFMSGTFVFADTIDKVFDDLFSDVNEAVDVQVQGVTLFDGGFGGGEARENLDISIVDTVAAVEGVDRAAPFVQTLGFGATNRVIGPDGEVLGASQGPPTLLESWIDDDVLNPYDLADGAAPTAADQIALNVAAADDAEIEIGDTLTVLTQFGESSYTLVGTFTFGEAESAAGAISADFTLPEAQRIAGLDGLTQVVVAAGDGSVDDETLTQRVAEALPDGAEAITGEEASAQDAANVQEGFAFFRQLLTIFGAIALLVGTFIISNTFSILVAQRTRELALLRAIGASRRQVLTSVMLEAAVIGLVAAVLGLLGGVALAIAVTAGLSASGADLPTSGLVISSTTVLIAFVIGLGVTMIASLLPAVQATRVPPLAALREVAVDRAGASKARIVVGIGILALGAWNLSAAWRDGSSDSIPVVGLGAIALIVGAIVIGPVLAEPTVRILGGWLPRVKGVTGRLATENAARSPKRTSATASALLIGVALIGFITIFGESARVSVRSEVERGFTGDLIVQADAGFGPPGGFSPTVADDIAATDGVDSVTRVGFTQGQVAYDDGDTATDFVFALDPESAEDAFTPRMSEGAITDLGPGGLVVDVGVAENHALAIGDTVTVTGTGGQMEELRIDAISDDFTLLGNFSIDFDTYGKLVTEQQLVQVIVVLADGADLETVQADLETVVADIPSVNVLDREEFIGDLASQITSFLTLINALLLLSIVIAMIGIANTLSLSIHERTRELGLLRAVGMSRSQLRSAVRWEAVIISLLGTIVGLGVGLLSSWALVTALGSFGLSTFSIPVPSMIVVMVASAALGVLASIRPARRAAKLDILDAIGAE